MSQDPGGRVKVPQRWVCSQGAWHCECYDEVESLQRERDEARASLSALTIDILKRYMWQDAPCVLCGYDGADYYQANGPHECARRSAALEGRDA